MRARLAVMLKGPTGCGKTRFVEHMAWRLGRPLITVACHDDLTASDLIGRFLIRGGGHGLARRPADARACAKAPSAISTRVVEARQDTVVVHASAHRPPPHPAASTRPARSLDAAPGFQLVVSYNPGYQHVLKDLKPSTRQRFVALEFDFPPAERGSPLSCRTKGGASTRRRITLVTLTRRLRRLRRSRPCRSPQYALIVATARLVASGIPLRTACASALLGPLTDDPDLLSAMHDLVSATL